MRRKFARLAAELPAPLLHDTSGFSAATALVAVLRTGVSSARAPPLPG